MYAKPFCNLEKSAVVIGYIKALTVLTMSYYSNTATGQHHDLDAEIDLSVPVLPMALISTEWFDPAETDYVGTSDVPDIIDTEHLDADLYRLSAYRIDSPPVLDGRLDDPSWRLASAASGFRQFAPDEGRRDSQRTEVRVLYDSENIYFGVMCYDREPERIVATEMRRDINLDDDDSFDMVIAPYGDNGDSYYFITNPLGARRDALVGPGGQSWNPDWDGIWSSYGAQHEMGWSVEIAIPFKTFRFNNEENQEWAINFGRHVQRTYSESFWVPVSQREGFFGLYRFARGGRLTELRNIKPGRSFEMLPYTVIGDLGTRRITGRNERIAHTLRRDMGVDMKWGITSGITADITINPDFAQIEADREVVNLSRFEFRFQERRPFFLEGSSTFQFGGNFSPLSLFFSRRIGTQLFNGETVRILHGEKISGRTGRTEFGILNVQTEETPWSLSQSRISTVYDTIVTASGHTEVSSRDSLVVSQIPFRASETNWNVVRMKRNILGRSSIGLIGLLKEPEDTPDGRMAIPVPRFSKSNYNRVIGIDSNLQFDSSRHQVQFLLARSFLTEGESHQRILQTADSTALNQPGRDWAGSISHSWRNAWLNVSSSYTDIRAGFFADMGFVTRRNIRRADASVGVNRFIRKWGIRSIGAPFGGLVSGRWVTNHNRGFFNRKQVESWNINVTPGVQFENGASLNFAWRRSFDRLNRQTGIAGVHFLPGEYTFDTFQGRLSTDRGKRVSTSVSYRTGNFYSGKLRNISVQSQMRPTARALIGLEVDYNRLSRSRTQADDLGNRTTFDERWIPRMRLNYSFSTELFISAFVQMNAGRQALDDPLRVRTLTSNLLLAYTMQQGHTFFIAYNQFNDDAFDVNGRRALRPASQALVAKFSYLFNI